MQHAGGRIENLVDVRGGEFEVGSHGVNEPAILASHVDDQRLAGRAARVDAQGLDVHTVSHQGFGGKTSQDVVADTGADGDTDAQPGEVHGGVGGSAADVENKLIDRDELARARQASDRRRQMIDDHHARARDHGQGGGRNSSFRRIWHGHDCRFPAREGRRTAGVTAGKHERRLMNDTPITRVFPRRR